MNVTATTLPRKSASVTSAPSWEVSAKSGAAPIVGSRCSCSGRPHAPAPAPARSAAPSAMISSRAHGSRLQLALELVRKRQSVPSARSSFGLDLIMPTSCRRSA